MLERQEAERALRDDYLELREELRQQAAELRAVCDAVARASASAAAGAASAVGDAGRNAGALADPSPEAALLVQAAERLEREQTELTRRAEALAAEIATLSTALERETAERLRGDAALRETHAALERRLADATGPSDGTVRREMELLLREETRLLRQQLDGQAAEIGALREGLARVCERPAGTLPAELAVAVEAVRGELQAWVRRRVDELVRVRTGVPVDEGIEQRVTDEVERRLGEQLREHLKEQLQRQPDIRAQIHLQLEAQLRAQFQAEVTARETHSAQLETRLREEIGLYVQAQVERRLGERLQAQLTVQEERRAQRETQLREQLERQVRPQVERRLGEQLQAQLTVQEERRAQRETRLREQLERQLRTQLQAELRTRAEEHGARTGAEMAVRLSEMARSVRAEVARERETLHAGFDARVETALTTVRAEREALRGTVDEMRADVEALRVALEREITERGRAENALRAALEQESRERMGIISSLGAAQATLQEHLAVCAARETTGPFPEPGAAAGRGGVSVEAGSADVVQAVEIARVAEQLRRERGARRRLEAAVRDLGARIDARPGPAPAPRRARVLDAWREPAGVPTPGSSPTRQRLRGRSRLLAAIRGTVRIHADRIGGMADLVLDTGLTPGQRRWLGVIKGSAAAVLDVLGRGAAASGAPTGQRSQRAPFAVWDCVREALEPLGARARRRDVRLSCHMGPEVPEVLVGDGPALAHVVTNVVENAVRCTESGEVTISIGVASRAPTRVVLLVGVTDSGGGLTAPQQQRLFDLLATDRELGRRKPAAAGLGLPVAASLVRAMGGRLWFESEPEHGSCFRFTVPFDAGENDGNLPGPEEGGGRSVSSANPEARVEHRFLLRRRALRVLLAESDPAGRLETARALEELGYDVVAVEDGQRAMAMVVSRRFDVAVLALRMPRMDAFEATASIRTRGSDDTTRLPIVAVAARVSPVDRERALAAGIDTVVERTRGAVGLVDAIETVVGLSA